MQNFDKTVPFDPGFSKISFSFIENIQVAIQDYKKLKANNQKKFWLMKFEPTIIEFINRSTAFYLGCMLWGSFIHYRFKADPKQIEGNNTQKLSEKELQEFDCSVEVKAIQEYIKSFDRDCKYFLNRPAKISELIKNVLDSYIEFAKINENFTKTNSTKDIKIPKAFEHFENLSDKKLDALCEQIYSIINSGKIETLLEIGFYN